MKESRDHNPPRLAARVRFSAPVEITLTLTAEHLEPEWVPAVHNDPEYLRTWATCLGTVPVTAWANDRALCTQLLLPDQARALLRSGLFRRPTRILGAMGRNEPDPRFFRAEFFALMEDPEDLLTADLSFREGGPYAVSVRDCPLNTTGLWLGWRWCHVTLTSRDGAVPRLESDVDLWAHEADRAFSAMLFPDPAEAAERLLRSIPGLGGEVG